MNSIKDWLNGHDISNRKMKGEINRKEYERQMETRGSIIITFSLVVLVLAIYSATVLGRTL